MSVVEERFSIGGIETHHADLKTEHIHPTMEGIRSDVLIQRQKRNHTHNHRIHKKVKVNMAE